MDAGDHAAWMQLPAVVQSRASIHADLRRAYRDAVEAGVIADDRTPPTDRSAA